MRITSQRKAIVSDIILWANIIVFAMMGFSGISLLVPQGQELILWGSNYKKSYFLDFEWWRLITSLFIHAGIIHLAFNCYALKALGQIVELIYGKLFFIFLYFSSGIIASFSSLLFYEQTNSVGASGAIFGIFGTFFSLLFTNTFEPRVRRALFKNFAFLFIINIFIGFSFPQIDNVAHISGFISGFFGGILIRGIIYFFKSFRSRVFIISLFSFFIIYVIMEISFLKYPSVKKYFINQDIFVKSAEVDKKISSLIQKNKILLYSPEEEQELVNQAIELCQSMIDRLKQVEYKTQKTELLQEYFILKKRIFLMFKIQQDINNEEIKKNLERKMQNILDQLNKL